MFGAIAYWRRRRLYRNGRVLTRWLAPDIRRDVEVLDASQIDAGLLTVRTRTWNVLYVIREMENEPPFGEPRTVAIEDLWIWSGELWGGRVARP